MASRQICAACGERYEELDPATTCRCGGLLSIEHDAPVEDGACSGGCSMSAGPGMKLATFPVCGDSGRS